MSIERLLSSRRPQTNSAVIVGMWFFQKWRARAIESGTYTAARQMKKQGVPFEVARFVLLRGGK